MVLKSISRKGGSSSFGKLADYILDKGKVMKGKDGKPYLFTHNVMGKTIEEVVRAFKLNERNRAAPRRSNSNVCYHEILSWHAMDAERLDATTLTKIAQKYCELRNKNALYFAAVHEDTDSKHMHFMVSALEAFSARSSRISKSQMATLKRELSEFELSLGITQSQVRHGLGRATKSQSEDNMERRTGSPSRKSEILSILERCFDASLSADKFYDEIKASGLSTYERGGRVAGIEDDGRHFRFATLGFGEGRFSELRTRGERSDSLSEIRHGTDIPTGLVLSKAQPEEVKGDATDGDKERLVEPGLEGPTL